LVQRTKTGENIPNNHKIGIPNGHKIYQMAVKDTKWPLNIPNGHKIYQHLPLHGPPKFTQIGIFGLKTNPSGNPVTKSASAARNCFPFY
jgi:hypothetical protein